MRFDAVPDARCDARCDAMRYQSCYSASNASSTMLLLLLLRSPPKSYQDASPTSRMMITLEIKSYYNGEGNSMA